MPATVVATRLSPIWKQVEKDLIEKGFTYGQRISKMDLADLLELERPQTAAQQNDFNIRFMANFTKLRDSLLKNHKIALRTMWGDSAYEAVLPEQQTDFAMNKGVKEIQTAMRTMRTILVNTPVHLLSADLQRKNADAQAKVAMLAGMTSRRTLLR